METDKDLMKIYLQGFNDELDNVKKLLNMMLN